MVVDDPVLAGACLIALGGSERGPARAHNLNLFRRKTVADYLKKASPPKPEDLREVHDTVSEILAAVRKEGETAVRRYSRQFDHWDPPSFRVPPEAAQAARESLPDDLLAAMDFAHNQIKTFAELQLESMQAFEAETLPGVVLGQKHIPIQSAGAYVPGGRYPMLMSAQMSVLTAKVAGVERVVACAPPWQGEGIYPPMLWSMALAGADEIYCVGGVQALGMMAFGMEGVEPVDFLAGPGNKYVDEAKRQLFGQVGIDLLAGPTEVCVIIDESADPVIAAADLLGQAEHGVTSPAVLISTSRKNAERVMAEIGRQLEELPTADVAAAAWEGLGEVVLAADDTEAVALADGYASEHLEVHTANNDYFLRNLRNYGSLFVGEEAAVVFSDKAIGTNHILPTKLAARYTGGLWVGKFLKTVTYQRCTREGALAVAPHAARVSEAELFYGHAESAYKRMEKYGAGKATRGWRK
jgi:sulfopropanediol 3-dehydrogenase